MDVSLQDARPGILEALTRALSLYLMADLCAIVGKDSPSPDASLLHTYDLIRELEGDSVADVLSYVEFEPKQVLENFRKVAEQGVREGKISPQERFMIMRAYERGLRGYTYLNVGRETECTEECPVANNQPGV